MLVIGGHDVEAGNISVRFRRSTGFLNQQRGVRRVLAAFRKATRRRRGGRRVKFREPLDAALLVRQVGQAAKAVTSHRTPNAVALEPFGFDLEQRSSARGFLQQLPFDFFVAF